MFHLERQVKLALIPFTSSSAGKTGMMVRRPVNTPCNCSFLPKLPPREHSLLGPPGPALRIHRVLGKSDRKTPAYFCNHSTWYPFICLIVYFKVEPYQLYNTSAILLTCLVASCLNGTTHVTNNMSAIVTKWKKFF